MSKSREEINREMREAEEALIKRLEAKYETAGHPKAAKLYAIAYQFGHAYGDNEIESYYMEMVDLIK